MALHTSTVQEAPVAAPVVTTKKAPVRFNNPAALPPKLLPNPAFNGFTAGASTPNAVGNNPLLGAPPPLVFNKQGYLVSNSSHTSSTNEASLAAASVSSTTTSQQQGASSFAPATTTTVSNPTLSSLGNPQVATASSGSHHSGTQQHGHSQSQQQMAVSAPPSSANEETTTNHATETEPAETFTALTPASWHRTSLSNGKKANPNAVPGEVSLVEDTSSQTKSTTNPGIIRREILDLFQSGAVVYVDDNKDGIYNNKDRIVTPEALNKMVGTTGVLPQVATTNVSQVASSEVGTLEGRTTEVNWLMSWRSQNQFQA